MSPAVAWPVRAGGAGIRKQLLKVSLNGPQGLCDCPTPGRDIAVIGEAWAGGGTPRSLDLKFSIWAKWLWDSTTPGFSLTSLAVPSHLLCLPVPYLLFF